MPHGPSRRDAVRTLGRSAAALACAQLAACAPVPSGPPPARVPLASLAGGQRVVVTVGLDPIEVMRSAEGVRARSLTCTHFGCRVSWFEEKRQYVCACHEGTYNPDGEPVSGPPLEPLKAVPAKIEGDEVVVGS